MGPFCLASCDEVPGAAGRGLTHGMALAAGFVLLGHELSPRVPALTGAWTSLREPQGL